jgi:hypothetical protein
MCNLYTRLYSITTNQAANAALFRRKPKRRQPSTNAKGVPRLFRACRAQRRLGTQDGLDTVGNDATTEFGGRRCDVPGPLGPVRGHTLAVEQSRCAERGCARAY